MPAKRRDDCVAHVRVAEILSGEDVLIRQVTGKLSGIDDDRVWEMSVRFDSCRVISTDFAVSPVDTTVDTHICYWPEQNVNKCRVFRLDFDVHDLAVGPTALSNLLTSRIIEALTVLNVSGDHFTQNQLTKIRERMLGDLAEMMSSRGK